jgi:hypothetical protein
MICISGCGHLYLPEKLGVIVLPSTVGQRNGSCMAERWVVQSVAFVLVKPTKRNDMN